MIVQEKYKSGPILIVSNIPQDQLFFESAATKMTLPNKLINYSNGAEALNHLKNSEVFPFLILSEIYLPLISGIELKKAIEADSILGLLCIPFIFFSHNPSLYDVREGFYLKAQGYFEKPQNPSEAEKLLNLVLKYWKRSELPVL